MRLPLELIGEIIDYMPDWYLPYPCSLVSKSWARLSQKRLFRTVNIHPRNLQKWLDTVPPTNAEVLGHVRVLSYKEHDLYSRSPIEPANFVLSDYFPSFRQLRSLTFSLVSISLPPQQVEQFSAFQHTLSQITLLGCCATKGALVTLINYFPNLAHLYICSFSYLRDVEPIPPLSRTSLKTLYVTEWALDSLNLLDELSELGLEFEEVIISDSVLTGITWSVFAMRVIHAFGGGAKRLRLHDTPRGMYHLS